MGLEAGEKTQRWPPFSMRTRWQPRLFLLTSCLEISQRVGCYSFIIFNSKIREERKSKQKSKERKYLWKGKGKRNWKEHKAMLWTWGKERIERQKGKNFTVLWQRWLAGQWRGSLPFCPVETNAQQENYISQPPLRWYGTMGLALMRGMWAESKR